MKSSNNTSRFFDSVPIEECLAELEDGRKIHQGWSPQCEKAPAEDNEWGVLKTTSIQPARFEPNHNKRLPTKLSPRPHLEVKSGDILLTCAGPRHRCGVSCLVRNTRMRLMISGKMYRFRANPARIRPNYLEAFLQTEAARQAIDRMKTGISDSGLNLTHDRFRQLVVPVTSTDQQQRIVAEIEKQFTRLDAGVASLKRVQVALKSYRTSVLKAACEGRLVPTEAELARKENRSYETGETLLQRILKERRKSWQGRGKYNEPTVLDAACIPTLPEGWGLASLEAIADVIDPNPSHRMPKYIPEGIPLVSSENFVGTEGIDFTIGKRVTRETLEQQRNRYTVEDGDFVLSRIGTIGRTRFLPTDKEYCLSHALVVLKVRSQSINKRWLRKTVASESILLQAHKGVQSVGVPDLGMAKIRRFVIPLPPIAEQTRIVAEVERRLSVIEELETVTSTELQRATRLRRAILSRAFAAN